MMVQVREGLIVCILRLVFQWEVDPSPELLLRSWAEKGRENIERASVIKDWQWQGLSGTSKQARWMRMKSRKLEKCNNA
jgi:hypothetical protein